MEYTYWPHNWGISEDDALMSAWQVLYAENVDLSSNQKYATVSRDTTQFINGTDEFLATFSIPWTTYSIVSDNDNCLYRIADSAFSTQKVLDAYTKIVHIWANSEYVYFLNSSEDIYRIAMADITGSDWSWDVALTDSTLPSWTWPYYTVVSETWTYLAYNTNLYVINNSTWTVDATTSYDFLSNNVVWMTKISDVIKIYQEDWSLLLWGWAWYDTIEESTKIAPEISNVEQNSNIDYIIASGGLSYINWYTLTPLFYNYWSDELQSNKINIARIQWPLAMASLKWIIYIAWQDNQLNLTDWTTSYWGTALITFWQKKRWTPYALNNFLTYASTWYKFETIYWVFTKTYTSNTSFDKVYVAYKDTNGSYWVDWIDIDAITPVVNNDIEWIIVYKYFDWWLPEQKKKWLKIWVRTDLPDDGCTIEVFKIVEADPNMIKLWEFAWPLNKNYFAFEEEFYNITLAVRLINDSSDKLKHYNITLEYDEVKESY